MNRWSASKYRLLIVGDDGDLQTAFEKSANNVSAETDVSAAQSPLALFELHLAVHLRDAQSLLESDRTAGRRFDAVVMNIGAPPRWDAGGYEDEIWTIDPHLNFAICTECSNAWYDFSQRLGLSDRIAILSKPCNGAEVVRAARSLCEKRKELSSSLESLDRLQPLLGAPSRQMSPVS